MPITPQAIDFLSENRLQNNKEWFHAHKKSYEQLVKQPLLELSAQMGETMRQIDSGLVTQPSKTISRVWRDTRYTHDKSLFRDVMWVVFHREKGMAWPTFFFEFSPRGYRYGCGYYSAPTAARNKVAQWVLDNDIRYQKAAKALQALPECQLTGEMFKRTKYPQATPEQANWVERKELGAIQVGKSPEVLFADNLSEIILQQFTALQPYYEILLAAHLEVASQLPQRRR